MFSEPTYFEIWQKINVMSGPGIEKSHKVSPTTRWLNESCPLDI